MRYPEENRFRTLQPCEQSWARLVSRLPDLWRLLWAERYALLKNWVSYMHRITIFALPLENSRNMETTASEQLLSSFCHHVVTVPQPLSYCKSATTQAV